MEIQGFLLAIRLFPSRRRPSPGVLPLAARLPPQASKASEAGFCLGPFSLSFAGATGVSLCAGLNNEASVSADLKPG